MPVDLSSLESAIRTAIPVLHLEIEDLSSGCGENYSIVLVSEVSTPRLVFVLEFLMVIFARHLKGRKHWRDIDLVSASACAFRGVGLLMMGMG